MDKLLLKNTLSEIRLNTMRVLEKASIPSHQAKEISRCVIENLRLHIKRIHSYDDYASIIEKHLETDKYAQSGILCLQYITQETKLDVGVVRKYLHQKGYLQKKHYHKDNIYIKIYSVNKIDKELYNKYLELYITAVHRKDIEDLKSKIPTEDLVIQKQAIKNLYSPNPIILDIAMQELGYEQALHNKSLHYTKDV